MQHALGCVWWVMVDGAACERWGCVCWAGCVGQHAWGCVCWMMCDGAACAGLGVLGSMHWAVCVGLCALGCVSTGQRGSVYPWYLASWFCFWFVRVWRLSGACDFFTIGSVWQLLLRSGVRVLRGMLVAPLFRSLPSPTLPHTENVNVDVNELRLGFSNTSPLPPFLTR